VLPDQGIAVAAIRERGSRIMEMEEGWLRGLKITEVSWLNSLLDGCTRNRTMGDSEDVIVDWNNRPHLLTSR